MLQSKNIKIICGIAPGLDFNFQSFFQATNQNLNLLEKNVKVFKNGANGIAIMFDDIPFDYSNGVSLKNEGLFMQN